MPNILSEPRNKQIAPVRVTETELEKINTRAKNLHMTQSEYIRLVALNAEIKVKVKGGIKMKAVLEIEMPYSCIDCSLCVGNKEQAFNVCAATGTKIEFSEIEGNKLPNCPLKEATP